MEDKFGISYFKTGGIIPLGLSLYQLKELNRILSVYRCTLSLDFPLVLDEIIFNVQNLIDFYEKNSKNV